MPSTPPGDLPGSRRAAGVLVRVALALAAAAVYINALPSEFVWDDRHQVLENAWIRSFRSIPDVFLKDVWAFRAPGVNSQYYRPLMHLVYMFEYHLFGLSRIGFHLTNVIFHVCATLLVFSLLQTLLRRRFSNDTSRLAAATGALLFAVHPAHVEAVAWVASVPELTFSLACLAAFIAHVRASEGDHVGAYRVASVACFGLGLFAKETALVLPPLLVAYDALFTGGPWARRARAYLWYGGPVVVWFALRSHALGVVLPMRASETSAGASAIAQAPGLFWEYVRLIVWPVDFNAYRVAVSLSSPSYVLAGTLVGLLALAGVALALWRRAPLASLGIGWIALPLIPAVSIGLLGQEIVADRYTYFPSVGLSLLVALSVAHASEASGWIRWMPAAALTLAIPWCAWATVSRNAVWNTELGLWTDTAMKSPQSSRVQDGLGQALLAAGRVDEAIERFRLALTLGPKLSNIHLNLGLAYVKKGWMEQALAKFIDAIKLWPEYPKAHYCVGLAYGELGMTDQAIAALQTAARLSPGSGDALRALGNIHVASGKFEEALESYQLAVERAPWDAYSHDSLGALLARAGRFDEAHREFQEAVRLNPSDPKLRRNLELVRQRIGRR